MCRNGMDNRSYLNCQWTLKEINCSTSRISQISRCSSHIRNSGTARIERHFMRFHLNEILTRSVRNLFGLFIILVGSLLAAMQQPTTTDQKQPAESEPAHYRLAAGDTIQVRFFFNPELNDEIQIRPDGRITMQLVGEVV